MAISNDERESLRRAWSGYCRALAETADEAIDGGIGDPRDADELAELLRSIARIASMTLSQRLDFNDPDFPLFFRQMDDRFRYGGPDTNIAYFMAALRGDATYRIRGNNSGGALNIGQLWHDNIVVAPDGTFEVTASAEPANGNWTALAPSLRGDSDIPDEYPVAGHGMAVRRYDWDWELDNPPGWLAIERIDENAPAYPQPLTATGLAAQIENATRLFVHAARWWNERAANIRRDTPPNVITPPSMNPPGVKNFKPPQRDDKGWLYYGISCYDLADDEAILIETDFSDGPYWSFTLYNTWWESPDILNRQTSLNAQQTFMDIDGKVRFVVSARDTGSPNWLDTGGSKRGFLHYRWFRPDQKLPTPTSRLMTASPSTEARPAGHPTIDAKTRRAIISRRREQLVRRFQR